MAYNRYRKFRKKDRAKRGIPINREYDERQVKVYNIVGEPLSSSKVTRRGTPIHGTNLVQDLERIGLVSKGASGYINKIQDKKKGS